MLAGEHYNARDPQLLKIAHRARDLLAIYNATPPTETATRQEVLSSLLGSPDWKKLRHWRRGYSDGISPPECICSGQSLPHNTRTEIVMVQ